MAGLRLARFTVLFVIAVGEHASYLTHCGSDGILSAHPTYFDGQLDRGAVTAEPDQAVG
jgi:hypothetical protein